MSTTAQTTSPSRFATLTPFRGVPILPPAGDPRQRFPLHLKHLQDHLAILGEDPAQWAVLEAVESRLDEYGMEVRFNLIRRGATRRLLFRWVTVEAGQLVGIRDRPDPG